METNPEYIRLMQKAHDVGITSPAALARRITECGYECSPQMVGHWKHRGVSHKAINAAAMAVNSSPAYILTGKEPEYVTGVSSSLTANEPKSARYMGETVTSGGHNMLINDESLMEILKRLSAPQKMKLAELAENMDKLNRAVLADVLMKFGTPVTDEKVEKYYPPVPKHQTQ